MIRRCTKCQRCKPIAEFTFKSKATGLRHSQCRECTRASLRVHYVKNKSYYLSKTKKRTEAKNYIYSYLLMHPCVDCGEKDPVVLEFDHKRDKVKAVSQLIRKGCTLKVIKEEVGKCEVRCANCHRRKTAEDFHWSKKKINNALVA